jgi:glutamate--cysteine ligase
VLVALTADARAADRALAAVAPVAGRWTEAARDGLADPALRAAALACFEAALTALPGVAGDPALTALVESFTERYVARGRCPGDDLLDRPARSGRAANLAHPDARDDQPRAESLEIR